MDVMDLSIKKRPQITTLPYNILIKHEPPYEEIRVPTSPRDTFLINHLSVNPLEYYPPQPPLFPLSSSPTRSDSSEAEHSESMRVTSSDSEKDFNFNTLSVNSYAKPSSRPFKAIAPLGLALGGLGINRESLDAYEEFRQRMLSHVQTNASTGVNKNMRRTIQSNNDKNGDPGYLEKRKRNNEAAKRSRDARRAKEDEIAIRCAFLEQENLRLKLQLAAIEKQKRRMLGLTRN